jgi:hypothetical protein
MYLVFCKKSFYSSTNGSLRFREGKFYIPVYIGDLYMMIYDEIGHLIHFTMCNYTVFCFLDNVMEEYFIDATELSFPELLTLIE